MGNRTQGWGEHIGRDGEEDTEGWGQEHMGRVGEDSGMEEQEQGIVGV